MAERVGGIYYDIGADTKPLIDAGRVVDRETSKMAGSFNAITAAIKLLAVAMALVKASQMADEMRLLSARVEVAAGSIEKGAAAMGELRRVSQRTQTQLEANVSVFNRLNSSILQMGGTQQDTLRITELLGMAIKVSGASGTEAASAMTQFGQALGSGVLQGDELRSLLENAPYLMQQLAAGIGVPVGALKKLGEEGKLTADVVTTALSKAAEKIQADFARMPQTFDAALGGAADAAARANEALDTLTGTSAALTGIAQGTGSVLNMIAERLLGITTEGDRLARNDQVKAWASNTATVLSYVADAADFVSRAFRQAGMGLAGLAASAGAAVRGEFAGAREVLRQTGADIMAISDPQYAGAGIRQRIAALGTGTDGSDPMDRRAAAGAPASKLKAACGAGKPGKKVKAKDDGYVAQIEAEMRIQEEADAAARKFYEDQAAREEKATKDRAIAVAMARDLADMNDPAAQVRLDAERKMAALDEALSAEQLLMSEYAAARVALEESTATRLREIDEEAVKKRQAAQSAQLQGFSALFGGMADIQKTFAGEQDGVYKALFAASKAFAIADSIIKIQQGIASASSLPFPANLGAMATVAAQTAGIVSTIQGTNYGGGRQYGGPASAGSMYRVNETGQPEMFTASNGAQYMLPTQSGSVTPANQIGGGASVAVYQTFHFNGDVFSKADTIALIQRGGEATQAAVLDTLDRTRR